MPIVPLDPDQKKVVELRKHTLSCMWHELSHAGDRPRAIYGLVEALSIIIELPTEQHRAALSVKLRLAVFHFLHEHMVVVAENGYEVMERCFYGRLAVPVGPMTLAELLYPDGAPQ